MDLQAALVEILILFLLIGLNGFFVAVEFAVVSVPRPRITQLAAHGNKSAQLVEHLLADTDRVLAASQLGITMASLGLGWLGENLASQVLLPLAPALPPPFDTAAVYVFGFAVVFAIITSLHIVLGEQAPKMAAIQFSDLIVRFIARPIIFFDALFRPFVALLDRATELVLGLFHMKPVGAHKIIYTADELKQIVAESQHAGQIEPGERRMIHNVFDFGDRQVFELMVPRTDMVAVEDNATVEQFLKVFAESSHARYPVYSGNLDNVVGYIAIKDLLFELTRDRSTYSKPVKNLLRPALFVPESKRVSELLTEMQQSNKQLAIVIDEYGGTEGMATTENLLEEIVGGIGDERVTVPPALRRLEDDRWEVEAQLRVDEVNESLGTRLPESDEYETVAGLILTRLGRIPSEGELVTVGDLRLQVTRMNGPRIEKVLLAKPHS